ncbi:MAG: LysM peptidoglycan-binding domain-containing protein [Clostridia bacterium]
MQDFIIMPDGYVDVKIDLNFVVNSSRVVGINVIDELSLEESRALNTYSIIIYFVKPGDTLWSIAKRFRSTVDSIAKVNDIEDPNVIYAGQQLFIPRYHVRSKIATA